MSNGYSQQKERLLKLADKKANLKRSLILLAIPCVLTFLWFWASFSGANTKQLWPFWVNIVFFAVVFVVLLFFRFARLFATTSLMSVYCDIKEYVRLLRKEDTSKNKIFNLSLDVMEYFHIGSFAKCATAAEELINITTDPKQLHTLRLYAALSYMLSDKNDECRKILAECDVENDPEFRFMDLYTDGKYEEAREVLKSCSFLHNPELKNNTNLREVRVCYLLWLASLKLNDDLSVATYANRVLAYDHGTFMRVKVSENN